MSAGTSQNAYAAAGSKLNIVLDQGQTVYKKVLKKAYEIFIHALKYDVEKARGCPKCPLPLGSNEHETNFDGINEVHIADW